MTLSVIIVHYRVPYFLELCLLSVEKALQGLDAEILVVDNDSGDGTPELLAPRFPRVKWIVNTENKGFARANNQGLAEASGEYLLFLNPDTVLPEDFAGSCLDFYRRAASFFPPVPPGGIGVRMIDGSGRFLKESRRGFPSPWVAFCKLTGLTALFPRSRRFAGYYLGWLPADRPHPAPVLSGACLLVSRAALAAAGSFDESFFMYGEDIDLSYRLEKAGFRNYYFPGVTIIHFKGASTPKDTRYVRRFYGAMRRFRQKHFQRSTPAVFRFAMASAIGIRGALGAAGNALRNGFRGIVARDDRTPASRPAPDQPPLRSPLSWPTGDPLQTQRVTTWLNEAGQLAADERTAGEVIFCQGEQYSFREMISALQQKPAAQRAAFYAAGGQAVIGSPHRDNRGTVRVLEGKFADETLQPPGR
ncbi:MAG TPA: glycosyltransferase family 2 protein [Puia sp.]|nr:glycosyltransferase family 2 protein [Puia sp.]